MPDHYESIPADDDLNVAAVERRDPIHSRFVHAIADLPRWLMILLSVSFLAVPFLLAYFDGTLGDLISTGLWRTIIVAPLIILYIIFLVPVFERLENRVVAGLRSLLVEDDDQIDPLLAEAAHVKAGHELLAFLAGIVIGLVLVQPWRADGASLVDSYNIIATLTMFGLLGVVIYGSMGSTRVTSILLSQPLKIDLFNITPFEPVGRLSMALAMAFLGGALGSLLLVVSLEGFWSAANLTVYALLATVAIAVFFVNMWPTHAALSAVKGEDLANAEQNIDGAYRRLRRLAEEGNDGEGAAIELNAWLAVERRLRTTRTWPYNTEMLRTLFFSIMIPLLVALSRLGAAYLGG